MRAAGTEVSLARGRGAGGGALGSGLSGFLGSGFAVRGGRRRRLAARFAGRGRGSGARFSGGALSGAGGLGSLALDRRALLGVRGLLALLARAGGELLFGLEDVWILLRLPFRLLLRGGALGMLAHDPRPQYHDDPDRLYGVLFAGYDIQFTVKDGVLAVRDVVPEGTGDVSP